MHSVFELLMERRQFRAKLRTISFHDFINECSKPQRDKLLQFPGVVQAKTSVGLRLFDEQGALKLLCQFTQAGFLAGSKKNRSDAARVFIVLGS